MAFVPQEVKARFVLAFGGLGPYCLVERRAETAVSQVATSVCGREVRVGNRLGELFIWNEGDPVCSACAAGAGKAGRRS